MTEKRGQGRIVFAIVLVLALFAAVEATLLNQTEETSPSIEMPTEEPFDQGTPEESPLFSENFSEETIEEPLEEPLNEKTLLEIIEEQKEKLNPETEEYLKSVEDKTEERPYLVKYEQDFADALFEDVSIEQRNDDLGLVAINAKAEDIEKFLEEGTIEYIELDQDVDILGDSIPYYLLKTGATATWNMTNGSGVKVAILDTGIGAHDDLLIAGGVSFVDNNYYDSNGHGTAVAGALAATINNEGIAGTAPGVSLYSVKIMSGPSGQLSDAISGIEWAIEQNMSIVSMSLGFDSYSNIFKDVLEEAYDAGILLVAASGNEGTETILYPATYSSVIAVGATTENDDLAYFSSYGAEQELVAPGVDINTTTLGNGYGTSSGTSLAAPQVAGIAALLKSFNTSLSNTEIRNKLRNDAKDLGDPGWDEEFGYGLVQINLSTSAMPYINDSYYYQIFNISNYGLPNVSYWFWIEGNGSVDDVDFIEGIYLANITYQNGAKMSRFYNVTENGSIFLITLTISHSDDYAQEALSLNEDEDGIVWVGRNYYATLNSPPSAVEGDCFNKDGDVTPMDYCFFESTGDKNDCEDNFTSQISCGSGTICNSSSVVGGEHRLPATSVAGSFMVQSRFYSNCGTASPEDDTPGNTLSLYVIDKKRAVCSNSSNFAVQGHYGNGNWVQIGLDSCGSGYTCHDSANYTSPTNIVDPCLQSNTCSGQIQVIVGDSSGAALRNLLVSREEVSNKTTDVAGTANYNMSRNCGEDISFSVYCSNTSNPTFCDTKKTALDFVGDYDSLIFDCTVCNGKSDLVLTLGGINISTDSNRVTANVTIENINSASNVNLTIRVQDKTTGLISREKSSLFSISGDRFKIVPVNISLSNADFVHVYVDATNKVNEPKTNNYVAVPVITEKMRAFVSVDTGFSTIDQAIKDYINLFVIPTSQNQAQVKIIVSLRDRNPLVKQEKPSSKNKEWFVDSSTLYVGGNPLGPYPYTGIVATEDCNFDFSCLYENYVFVVGNDVDGVVAATKRLIDARSVFARNLGFNRSIEPSVIDKNDIFGLSVYDLMHNPENKDHYRQNNADFANVVTKILTDNNYEVAIKTVRTTNDNTTLRIKNLNSDFSQNFKDSLSNDSRPIVFSGGLWNDLFYWEESGDELIDRLLDRGRDIWEIEITGGPEQDDVPNAPNYGYNDLRDYYWPALIAGVQEYSGEDSLQYVGHSNGCGLALASINQYQASGKNNAGYYFDTDTGQYLLTDLSSNAIDTYVGVGCPGALNGYSPFYEYFNQFGFRVAAQLNNTHITAEEVSRSFLALCHSELNGNEEKYCILAAKSLTIPSGDYKVSKKLLTDYIGDLQNISNGPQVSEGLSINNFRLYSNKNFSGGTRKLISLRLIGGDFDANQLKHDIVVSQEDSGDLAQRISSSNSVKLINLTNFYHGNLNFDEFIDDVGVFLND